MIVRLIVEMFTSLRYPTKQQGIVWLRRRRNEPSSEIAKSMKVSRPYITKAQRIAEERITTLIRHTASVSRINLRRMSPTYGIGVGHCPSYNSDAYITFSPNFGLNVWYDHMGDCESCEEKSNCEQVLRNLAEEWEVEVPNGVQPTLLAKTLFDTILRNLKWN